MEITIHAKSSSNPDEPYEVSFLHKDGKISVLCNCPAGEWAKLCKHKLGLIGNDTKMLYDIGEMDLLLEAHQLIQGTSLMDVYSNFDVRRKEIEEQQQKLKKELSDIKNQLGRMLHDGVE